jgi:monovalent cation:H+ antiporter-2, CPA2 family
MDPLLHAEPTIPFIHEAVVLMASAVLAVATLHRLRISPVIGYLVAGVAIGPAGLALIGDVDAVRTFAELGVVFLLFMMGLDLSFERLKAMRRLVFGLGGLQVVLCTGAIAAAVYMLGYRGPELLVIGGALALSSTAVVMQVLIERGEAASRFGRTAFAVLLLQDLAVVPLLVTVNVLGGDAETIGWALGIAGTKALVAVAIILVLGRYALRVPFRWVASTRSNELFMALALLAVLATGWLTHVAGLSMALGAFLAGLLLAETEFRPQVESDVGPFKGLLIGLFFMAIGLSIDINVVWRNAPGLIAAVLGLIAVKGAIIAALCRLFGEPKGVALRAGLLLGPGGEFAFVILTTAIARQVLDAATVQFLLATTTLSILLTPGFAAVSAWLARRYAGTRAAREMGARDLDGEVYRDHVVIAGFGRVGQTVTALLNRQNVPFVAIDLDPKRVAEWRAKNVPVFFGDASRDEVLDRLGAGKAAALIVTLDDPEAAARTLTHCRRRWPELRIFVRAHDETHLSELRRLGASAVVPETLESSLTLARYALESLGTPAEVAERLAAEIRQAGYTRSDNTPPSGTAT